MKNYTIFMLDPEDHMTSRRTEAERIKGWYAGEHTSSLLLFYSGGRSRRLDMQVLEGSYFKLDR
jgi:hypothetical protein